MKEIIGVVDNGQIILPPIMHLPDGLRVRVIWDDLNESASPLYDREKLTEEDLAAELQWATGTRFSQ